MSKIKVEFEVPKGKFCCQYSKVKTIIEPCQYLCSSSRVCLVFGSTPFQSSDTGSTEKLQECLNSEVKEK